MKLYLTHYNDNQFVDKIKNFIKSETPNIKLYSFDESYTDDKKKALRVRGAFSASTPPFAVLKTDDEKYIKAFYSEADDCTVDKICNHLLYYYHA